MVDNANQDTLATWLGASNGRVVIWYNQSYPSAFLTAVGTNVWPKESSGVLSSTISDQPLITSTTPFPTFQGNGSSIPGVLFVKLIKEYELPGTFTLRVWAKAASFPNAAPVAGLGQYTNGIAIRTDTTFVMGIGVNNAASGLSSLMTTGVWTHIAVTRDSNNLVTVWIGTSLFFST